MLNISTLTISVADGNASFRNRRDGARAAQGVRSPGRRAWASRARNGKCCSGSSGSRASADRARRHDGHRADHAVADRRSAGRRRMVERVADPADRRAWRLHVTAKARPLVEKLRAVADEMIADAFAGIDPKDIEITRQVLRRARDNASRAAPLNRASEPMNRMQTEPMAPAEVGRGAKEKRVRQDRGPQLDQDDRHADRAGVADPAGGGLLLADERRQRVDRRCADRQDIVSVSPQVNGQVVEVLVRNGSRVKRGDLLFRVDPQPYRVALEQAQAALAAAQLQTQVLRTTAAGTGGDITRRAGQSRDQAECAAPPAGAAEAGLHDHGRL